ncbi:GAF and ANTAR domain-containing protein [Streptomyces montanisoli]|uniref:GAF and ANTAR domain-containing protein n=1 Tax=Streptomyces montanisoli TaxID=2798581 RepID=A0A940MFA3_9ACTN|nr:GAF and ANTAR domain-containing protein [Streptomyces montanisoli]MBP0460007.1 GAF and ANTAR domain-containing protein [Streptomyces montanisoli]
MTEILRTLHGQPGALTDGCAAVLGVDHLVLSLALDGQADGQATEQLWSSGEVGTSFEDLQFTLGEGPGHDVLRTGRMVLEQDVAEVAADRWPALLPAMAHLPIKAVFCLPLVMGGITLGFLTAVRSTSGAMNGQEMDDVIALVGALTLQFLAADDAQVDSWVGEPMDGGLHREVVHQATGMLSVQLSVSLSRALLRLRAYTYSHDRSIIDVAQDIVSRRLRLDEGDSDSDPDPDPPEETRG